MKMIYLKKFHARHGSNIKETELYEAYKGNCNFLLLDGHAESVRAPYFGAHVWAWHPSFPFPCTDFHYD